MDEKNAGMESGIHTFWNNILVPEARNLRGRLGQSLLWCGHHPALFFLLWSLWLSVGYLAFGSGSWVRIHDNGDSTLPLFIGGPVWCTSWDWFALGGIDRGTYGFQIVSVLFGILPGWSAYGLIMWVQRFIAGYFMFRLLRDNLKTAVLPCYFAGMSYALFAQPSNNFSWAGFTLYDGLGLPGLPFLTWTLLRLRDQRHPWAWSGALGLGILLGLGVSYAFAPFMLLAICFGAFVVSPGRPMRLSGMLVLLISGCVVINLPAVWAASFNSPLSHRAAWIANSPLDRDWLASYHFVLGIVRDNAVALGLAGAALMLWRGRDRRLLWLSIFLVLSLVGILCYGPLRAALSGHLGFLIGFQFDRVYLVIPFLAAAVAAISLDLVPEDWQMHFTEGGRQKWSFRVRILTCSLAVALVLWQSVLANKRILMEVAGGSNFATLYQNPEIQQLATETRQAPPFRVATIATQGGPALHPSYAWAYGLETVDGYVLLYPKRYQEFWEQVIGPLIKGDRQRYNYFHYWGSRVYLFSPSEGLPRESELRFGNYYRLELLSLANVRYIISPFPVHDERLSLLPSAVRDEQVRWASRGKKSKLLDILRGHCPGMPLFVYENRQTFPRYFLVGGARVFEDKKALLAALSQATQADLRSTAYLVRGDTAGIPLEQLGNQSGKVTILRQTSDQVELRVDAESTVILVAANSYSPYWRATIDGYAAPLFPTYHAFQGVVVPAGTHRVCFNYEPPHAGRSAGSHGNE